MKMKIFGMIHTANELAKSEQDMNDWLASGVRILHETVYYECVALSGHPGRVLYTFRSEETNASATIPKNSGIQDAHH